MAGKEEEFTSLVQDLDRTSTAYGMEINAEKAKLMAKKVRASTRDIEVNGQRLDMISSFKYLSAVVTDGGSKPEVQSKIAQASAALARLGIIWRDKKISLKCKVH